MKRHILFYLLLGTLFSSLYGQVAIGKQSVNGNSTLLDFDDTAANFKGIILPALDTAPTLTSANNGTFLFDKSDNKIKMYENSAWVELSGVGSATQIATNSTVESTNNQGVIIGATTSTANGILVLESMDKAMILPKIANPHTSVKSPYVGMICYDTVSKTMAVFDGSVWNYWK